MEDSRPDTIASLNHPMKGVCEAWLEKIALASKKKDAEFEQYAREVHQFYNGPINWMWQQEQMLVTKGQGGFLQSNMFPNFRICLNKPFAAVALYGPTLFAQYPNVQVAPAERPEVAPEVLGFDVQDPVMAEQYAMMQSQKQMDESFRQAHASIAQVYLNSVQRATNKKWHVRMAIPDGIVRGLGTTITKIYNPPGTDVRYPRSEFINECDYIKDSDATRPEEVQWIAVRCVAPRNKVAEEYGGNDPQRLYDSLKGHFQSHEAQSSRRGRKEAKQSESQKGDSWDLVEYWEIYSKNGFGDKLNTFTGDKGKAVDDFSVFGPFCYLVVCRGVPFPLNIPSWTLEEEEPDDLFQRVQWPIPFWTPPLCGWPVSELYFHSDGGSIWPIPMFKPLIGPIRFVNWCLSFLADKAASASTDYMVAMKSAADSIKNQLEQGVGPYKMLEIPEILAKANLSLDKIVGVLQAPNFHEGVWAMVSQVMGIIDFESGVTELLAGLGGDRQMRSAEEASVRQANTQIRPDDMAQKVEDWLTEQAKKEIVAAMWLLTGADVEPMVGGEAAMVWDQQMATQDFHRILTDFSYKIEAGSARKPNILTKQRMLTEYMQANGQMIAQLAMSGVVGPWNNYHKILGDINQVDMSGFMLPPTDPNQPPPPDPEQMKAEADVQVKQAELQMDEQKMGAELQMKAAELQMEQESHLQDLFFERAKFGLEMKHDEAKAKQDLQIQKEKGKAQVAATKAKAKAKPSTNGSKK